MKTFFERLWTRESPRRSVPRPTAIRPQLEALETRLTPSTTAIQTAVLKTDGELDLYNTQTGVFQLLSPAGTIGSVSAAKTASGQTVVFAVAIDTDAAGNLNTLWEYNAANGGWSEISTGYFQQVSAATNAAGNAVVFGVLGQGGAEPNFANSLWEYSNGGWKDLAQGSFAYTPYLVASVSAVGTAQGEVAFAIASEDQSLYEYTPSGGWSQISTGSFQQVSAGLDANGQADAFGVLGQGAFTGYANTLWEFDNGGWTVVPGHVPFHLPIVGNPYPELLTYASVAAGRNGEVFALGPDGYSVPGGYSSVLPIVMVPPQPNHLWGYRANDELSDGSFSQVSATQTSAGADVVFGTLTDGSLWEYANGGWTELLSGGVASTATPL